MRQRMGQDTRWLLERIPARFVRIEEIRCKYVCTACEQAAAETGPQIVVADKPVAPIDKGLAGPGLLAYIATAKFADFLPLYRLEAIFERMGFAIDRATQCLWMRDIAELVLPLQQLMIQRVLASHIIATDDTVLPMQAPGKTKKARIWIYRGDDEHPYNVFDFTVSRGRDGPAQFLKDYHGVLQADAYGGYEGICVGQRDHPGRLLGPCPPQVRRHPDARARRHRPGAGAHRAVVRHRAIGRGAVPPGPLGPAPAKERAGAGGPARAAAGTWKDSLLPKHPVAGAVGYVLNQWGPLTAFTEDPAIRLDNNLAEQQMKRIAMGRKAFLFVGNERGGQTAAILSSLTSTCQRHGIDPERYLTQVLANLPSTPLSQLDQWLPDVWKKRQTQAKASGWRIHLDPRPTRLEASCSLQPLPRSAEDGVHVADTILQRLASEVINRNGRNIIRHKRRKRLRVASSARTAHGQGKRDLLQLTMHEGMRAQVVNLAERRQHD